MSNRYKILAEASGGKLTEEDVYNLETYGVKHPSEFAPDPADEVLQVTAYVVRKI